MNPGDHKLALQWAGKRRRYLVHVPPSYDGTKPFPVMLMLHGTGGSARWTMLETGWGAKADQESFLAIFPEGLPADPGRPAQFLKNPVRWEHNFGKETLTGKVDDVGFLGAVLDSLPAHFNVDPRRIYITGFSGGAMMTFRFAAVASERIAAIAPVAGPCGQNMTRLQRAIPTIFLIGKNDPLLPLAGGEVISPWGHLGTRPPVLESLGFWAKALNCSPKPRVQDAQNGIERLAYHDARGTALFLVYLIDGLGHHWPGGKASLSQEFAGNPSQRLHATAVIWDFFRTRPLP